MRALYVQEKMLKFTKKTNIENLNPKTLEVFFSNNFAPHMVRGKHNWLLSKGADGRIFKKWMVTMEFVTLFSSKLWNDENVNGTLLKLHGMLPNSDCKCQKLKIFSRKEFKPQTKGNQIDYGKIFQTNWDCLKTVLETSWVFWSSWL